VSTTTRTDGPADGVLVYQHDAQLIEVGGRYIAGALDDGGAAVAFATAQHLRDLEAWVALCGTDLARAARDGRYLSLPIEKLPARGAEAAALDELLVRTLEQIPDTAEPVCVFGEVSPALRERLQRSPGTSVLSIGTALRAKRPVSLLCARHEDMTADPECAENTSANGAALVQPPAFPAPANGSVSSVVSSAVLPPAPAACGFARRLVRAACESETGADTIDTAVLVVSELAGNAVRHARSTFTAEVSFRNGSVRLAVTDARPLPEDWKGFPIAREHGLGLVAALAEDWSIEPLEGGKMVWADVPREEENH
jgi:anti-sigma regulatory factor (Ser/Thr protein kinase)